MLSREAVGRRHLHVVYGLFAVIVVFYTICAVRFPMAFIWATYEDLIGEWAQVWSLVFAMIGSVMLARRRWRYRWFFAVLALACFYVVMEEISWGQRLIGFASPEYFRKQNLQNETNLHNFLTGPYNTALKAAISYGLAGGLVVYGLVVPLALRKGWRWARRLDS